MTVYPHLDGLPNSRMSLSYKLPSQAIARGNKQIEKGVQGESQWHKMSLWKVYIYVVALSTTRATLFKHLYHILCFLRVACHFSPLVLPSGKIRCTKVLSVGLHKAKYYT